MASVSKTLNKRVPRSKKEAVEPNTTIILHDSQDPMDMVFTQILGDTIIERDKLVDTQPFIPLTRVEVPKRDSFVAAIEAVRARKNGGDVAPAKKKILPPKTRAIGEDYPFVHPHNPIFYDHAFTWRCEGVNVRRGKFDENRTEYLFFHRMGINVQTKENFEFKWNCRMDYLEPLIEALVGIKQEISAYLKKGKQ